MSTTTDRATSEAAAHRTPPEPAIAVDGLGIGYISRGRLVPTVHDVSFTVGPGATTALVGESGSGKTTLASAISGLLPENARRLTGQVRLHGRDVSRLDEHAWQHLRGRVLGYVPQDPLGSLDPLQTVGGHLVEAVRQARGGPVEDARRTAHELLETVHIAEAAQKFRAYPHELSGGQLQRVLIAGALAGNPGILIADEPTSALDVTVQKRVLDLLDELREELTLSVLLITHDLSLAAERSDQVVVLQHGRTVEEGAARQIIDAPAAAYTRQLFQDVPALTPHKYTGAQQDLLVTRGTAPERAPAIAVTGLRKSFGGDIPALDGVDLQVRRGEIHALVGESGSGKTTLARIVAGLVPYDAGTVSVNGAPRDPEPEVVNPDPTALQLIYQNPLAALDPRWRLLDLVAEPLRIGGTRRREARRRAGEMLTRVGLPAQTLTRRIGQLSGGQRQRVAIARALMLSPSILVLDEPTSALDVTVQSRIIDLLFDLRAERPELTLVFISHDLSLIRQIADSVTVLRRGQVIEQGPVADVFDGARQEYTRELLEAIPAAP